LTIPGKAVQDVYVGIDVWGRNQYGDGGFGTYRALTQIAPKGLGLSVALFAPAWTWETTEGKPDWTWNDWWKYDRKLWLGPEDPTEIVPVPPMSDMSLKKQARDPGVPLPGPFVPIVSYFENFSPPNPLDLPFVTFFSPGIGFRWFVEGEQLMDTHERGWTDVQKQTSLGNLIWPRPVPLWEEGGGSGPIPLGSTSLDFTDAWLGGSSVKVTLRFSGDEEAYFRLVWLPLQSIHIYPGQSYDVSLIYKTDAPDLDLEAAITVRSPVEFELLEATTEEFGNGWTELHVHFVLPADHTTTAEVRSVVGIVLGFATADPSKSCELPINIGLLSVYPSPPRPPSKLVHHKPKVLWANYLKNVLTWEIAAYFDPIPDGALESRPPDHTELRWEISPAATDYPRFMFFNIHVEAYSTAGVYRGPEHAKFVGTTGWDGRENRFYVEDTMLPEGLKTGSGVDVRFYVQGVTDRGEVLPWIDGVSVDAKL
jgi:mannosyl-glycoprotein endo-beta-N-acetylglucosaminidase